MNSDLYTTEDLINKFQISEATLHNWINKNYIPKPIKIGRRIYWRKEVIDNHVFDLEETQKPKNNA
jgi:predicted DNA-binding transcriptional regulator AlpA